MFSYKYYIFIFYIYKCIIYYIHIYIYYHLFYLLYVYYIIYIIYIYIYIIFIYYESYSVGVPQFVKTGVPGTTLKRLFILGILGRKYNFPRLVFFLKL